MRKSNDKASGASIAHPARGWLRIALLLLVIEKVIQHVTVTVALYFNLGAIQARLTLDFRVLLLANKRWTAWLLITLALLDMVGEFVAQGALFITITVSILAAFALLCLSLLYLRIQR